MSSRKSSVGQRPSPSRDHMAAIPGSPNEEIVALVPICVRKGQLEDQSLVVLRP